MSDLEIAKAAEEAIAHNLADVFENGPRLSTNRRTAALAIDRANRYVLKTGLGAMGVGTMWCSYSEEDPDWADLPERDCTGQFGGPGFDTLAAGRTLPYPPWSCPKCGSRDWRNAFAFWGNYGPNGGLGYQLGCKACGPETIEVTA